MGFLKFSILYSGRFFSPQWSDQSNCFFNEPGILQHKCKLHNIPIILKIHFFKGWPIFGVVEQTRFLCKSDLFYIYPFYDSQGTLGNGENHYMLLLVYFGPPYSHSDTFVRSSRTNISSSQFWPEWVQNWAPILFQNSIYEDKFRHKKDTQ